MDMSAWPHRAVGGNEADQMSLIHGHCACCLVPWPCPTQESFDEAALSLVGADLDRWRQRMAALGWSVVAEGTET